MSNVYSYGREEIVFAAKESAYGAHVLPLGANAMKVRTTSFNLTHERKDRNEKGSTRSITSRITGRKAVEWSLSKYLMPSGTAGTAPDDGKLLEALLGTETPVVSTSVTYSLLAEPGISLDLVRETGTLREIITGAVPTKAEISWGGTDEPKIQYSGSAKDKITCGRTTLAAAASSAALTVADGGQLAVGAYVQVGDQNNTGAGYKILSIVDDTVTVDTSVTEDNGEAVFPMPVTPVTTGAPFPTTVGSVTVFGDTMYTTKGSISIDQKVELRNDEFATESATGMRYPGFREVMGSLDLYLKASDVKYINDAKAFGNGAIVIVFGNTAGSICTISIPAAEITIPNVEIPEEGECTITLEFKGLGSTGEDEISIAFT